MNRAHIGIALVFFMLFTVIPAGAQGSTYLATISTYGYITYDAFFPAISADGRYTAFASDSPYLVPLDTNMSRDVFVHDAFAGTTTRVSLDSFGKEANADSGIHGVSISDDGRYVVFASHASNLVPGDTNFVEDVFLHDRTTGATTRISVDTSGVEANGPSYQAEISGSGLFVAFTSSASNLVMNDLNLRQDVFVRDLTTGVTTRISVDSLGKEGNDDSGTSGIAISGTGLHVAFDSSATNLVSNDTNGYDDIFVHDRSIGSTTRVSVSSSSAQSDWDCALPRISSDGRIVAFASAASNLVSNDTNLAQDVFVRDRQAGTTERVSVSSAGKQADMDCAYFSLAISRDGNVVAFESGATTLVPNYTQFNLSKIFLHDRKTHTTSGRWFSTSAIVGNGPDGMFGISLSSTGRFIAFSSYAQFVEYDIQPYDYIFVYDRQFVPNMPDIGGSTHLICDKTSCTSEEPSVSGDGRYICFSDTQAYMYDRLTGLKTTVSVSSQGVPGNAASKWAAVSTDGRYVAFESAATNLVSGDTNNATDIFVRDTLNQQTVRVSVSSTGMQGDGNSERPSISSDGRYVTFQSVATNLVAGDTNLKQDIFIRDTFLNTTSSASVNNNLQLGNGDSANAAISGNGMYTAFQSAATNLVTGDLNGKSDVFLHDNTTGITIRVSVDSSGGEANGASDYPSLSADGSLIAFQSEASNLIPVDVNLGKDIFVHDKSTGSTTRVSEDSQGVEAFGGDSTIPFLSADGRYVTFASNTHNLVQYDRNYLSDVFLHDRQTRATSRISASSKGYGGNNCSGTPSQTANISPHTPISADGRVVVFNSWATNLVPDGSAGLLVRDLYPRIYTQDTPRIGTAVNLDLFSPGEPGKFYQAASSYGFSPGIPLGNRILPLNLDQLLVLSMMLPSTWVNFVGILDATGNARARIVLPPESALAGLRFFTAFLVIDSSAPQGIGGISNALPLTIVP